MQKDIKDLQFFLSVSGQKVLRHHVVGDSIYELENAWDYYVISVTVTKVMYFFFDF